MSGRRALRPLRGGRLLASIGAAISLSVVLALTSTASYAAWTASTSKSVTSVPGQLALTSAPNNAPTITTLNGHVYSAAASSITKPLTFKNTGSIPFKLSSVDIQASGTLPPAEVTLKVWQSGAGNCTATANPPTANFRATSLSLASLNVTVAPAASAVLCVSTSFTGDSAARAGLSITSVLTFNAHAGPNWKVADAASASDRTFTQTVYQLAAPTVSCETISVSKRIDYRSVAFANARISWTVPAAAAGSITGFVIKKDGTTIPGVTLDASSRSVDLSWEHAQSGGVITVQAVTATGSSADSLGVAVKATARSVSYYLLWEYHFGDVRCA